MICRHILSPQRCSDKCPDSLITNDVEEDDDDRLSRRWDFQWWEALLFKYCLLLFEFLASLFESNWHRYLNQISLLFESLAEDCSMVI